MSEDAKWIVGIGIPILVLLAGVIWKMLDRRLESLWDQVGRDSDHGMRKTVHDSSNKAGLAYGTCDLHEKRLDRLERRVFNGHGPEHDR